jgi:hypothetical protein
MSPLLVASALARDDPSTQRQCEIHDDQHVDEDAGRLPEARTDSEFIELEGDQQ